MARHTANPCDDCGANLGEAGGRVCEMCAAERSLITEGDPVWYRGKYAIGYSLRGRVEVIDRGVYGVRLENDNYALAGLDQLRPRRERCRYCHTGEGAACDCV